MRKEDIMNPELENALRSLQPQSVQLDISEAAFTAGKRTVRRQVRLWQTATAVLLAAAVGPWLLPHTSNTLNAPPIAQVPAVLYHPQTVTNEPLSQVSLVRLQQAVDKQGLAGLPETSIPPVGPLRIDGL